MNPKYKPNKKNGYIAPICNDSRKLYVPIGCGVCRECLKKKASEWKVRLSIELRKPQGKVWFVTYTFNEEALEECLNASHGNINMAAKIAVRRWYERERRKTHKTIKHWLITERGHDNTERLHLHGLVWGTEEEARSWPYGHVYLGEYVNQKTINYIVKYISKEDKVHKEFRGKIFTSKGIGNSKLDNYARNHDKFKLPNGQDVAIPIYLRNKIFTENEREELWTKILDKNERWIDGIKYDISTDEGLDEFQHALTMAQKRALELGYEKPIKKRYKNSIENFGNLNKSSKFANET